MAAVDPAKNLPANPCCSAWIEKCSKSEKGRNYLRLSVNLLTENAEKIQAKNVSLAAELKKKQEEAEQLIAANRSLEKDVISLNSELSLLKRRGCDIGEVKEAEVSRLRDLLCDTEKRNEELAKLVEKEKKRADLESKKAEAEKKSAAEAWKQVTREKSVFDESRKHAMNDTKKSEQLKLKIEELEKVVDEANKKLSSQAAESHDAMRNLEAEKCKLRGHKERIELAMQNEHKLNKILEETQKTAKNEKSRADKLVLQLEECMQRIQVLQKRVEKDGLKSNICDSYEKMHEKYPKFPVANGEITRFEHLMKQLKDEKENAAKKKKRLDSLRKKVKKHKKLAEEYRMMAKEDKNRAVLLSNELVEERLKVEGLKKQLNELLLTGRHCGTRTLSFDDTQIRKMNPLLDMEKSNVKETYIIAKDDVKCGKRRRLMNEATVEVIYQLGENKKRMDEMQKQIDQLVSSNNYTKESTNSRQINSEIKFLKRLVRRRKDQYRQAKQEAILEKEQNRALYKEFNSLRLEFLNIYSHVDMVGKLFGHKTLESGEIEKNVKVAKNSSTRDLKSEDLGKPITCQKFSPIDPQILMRNMAVDASDFNPERGIPESSRSNENFMESISGIDSTMELIMEDNNKQNFPSSRMNSSSSPSPDDRLIGSQEGGASPEKILEGKKHSKHNVSEESDELGDLEDNFPRKKTCLEDRGSPTKELIKHLCADPGVTSPCSNSELDAFFDSFFEKKDRDIMDLFNFDDPDEEQRYREAMESPLSPTLPELPTPETDAAELNPQVEGFDSVGNVWTPNITGNVEDDVNPVALSHEVSEVLNNLPDQNPDILGEKSSHGSQSDAICTTSISITESGAGSLPTDMNTPIFLSGDANDFNGVLNYFDTSRPLVSGWIHEVDIDSLLRKMLPNLKNACLTSKENACAIFSILVRNLSHPPENSQYILSRDFMHLSDNFSKKFESVMSDPDMRSLLGDLVGLDELLTTIENCLLNGQIINEKVRTTSKSASTEQLLAGIIILAAIRGVADSVESLIKFSLNLLVSRMCDDSVALKIVHIFAHLGKEKFLSSKHPHTELIVLKSVVTTLEENHAHFVSAGAIHLSASCPFSREPVPAESVAAMLMEQLDSYASASVESQSTNPSCMISEAFGRDLWRSSETLSLMEIFASRMDWSWTCSVIIPKLLHTLKGPFSASFLTGLLALLGHLGRNGTSSRGYDDEHVANVKTELSSFLLEDPPRRLPLPSQFVAVSSVLELVPFDFRAAVTGGAIVPPSQRGSAQAIREWFSRLREDHQAFALKLFRSPPAVS